MHLGSCQQCGPVRVEGLQAVPHFCSGRMLQVLMVDECEMSDVSTARPSFLSGVSDTGRTLREANRRDRSLINPRGATANTGWVCLFGRAKASRTSSLTSSRTQLRRWQMQDNGPCYKISKPKCVESP